MFLDSLDIANRGCIHLGATQIASPSEDSVNNNTMSMLYDKLRRAELQRNDWVFSIKTAPLRAIDTTTFELAPAQWNAGIQYLPGSVVADANGQLYVSTEDNNIGNDPATSSVWNSYFGSMTVDAYDTTGGTAYYAGDLVYITKSDGSYIVYLSRVNSNTEAPNTADVWNATTTYKQDDTVSYSGSQWRSLIAFNTNNTPVQGPANWVASQTYAVNVQVTGTDGFIYTSQAGSNVGNNPVTDGGTNWVNTDVPNAWSSTPTIPASSNLWTPLFASLRAFNFVYPLGSGPLSQSLTKNMYRKPAGFLRICPQKPKAGISSFLGAPSGHMIEDWQYEGKFIISQEPGPILFRFAADVIKVTDMDDMFCEGLGARMGLEGCETITNSTAKQQTCNTAYMKFMGEARMNNAIEIGPVEPPEDDYITCRI